MPTPTPAPSAEPLPRPHAAADPPPPSASLLARAASRLRAVHLVGGLVLLVVFLGTGQYMDLRLDHLRGMDDATRLLFRSNHIYILFGALLNLALAGYLTPRSRPWAQALQLLASALLLLGCGLLVRAFFVEPVGPGLERPLTRPALYLILDSTLLHLLTLWGDRTKVRPPAA